jgi:precorrin-3B C17-methyltransferase
VTQRGKLFIVGIGPGERAALTGQAAEALRQAEVVVGYNGYLAGVADLIEDKEALALPLGEEAERARLALGRALEGKIVCVVSGGDPGIYGMASVVLEAMEELPESRLPDVAVVPGVSAVNAAAALVGAPLGHDFAVISLSDLLTPWAAIENRLNAAAEADFVLALLNPRSRKRDWQLRRAREILLGYRLPGTVVGIVRNAYRPEQAVEVTTLGEMPAARVDMFTTVIVGSSSTRRLHDWMVTPRGYEASSSKLRSPDRRDGHDTG